jgi:hypothetical protein
MEFYFCRVSGPVGSDLFRGVGEFAAVDCTFESPDGPRMATTAVTSQVYAQRLLVVTGVADGGTCTRAGDLFTIDTGGGAVNVFLPAGNTCQIGHPVTIKALNTAGTVVVNPTGADKIDALAGTFTIAAGGGGLWGFQRFVYGGTIAAATRWLRV